MSLLLATLALAVDPLEQATAARLAGNFAGAAAYLDAVRPLVDPEDEARWNLERGLAEELQWRPGEAEPYYRAAVMAGGQAAPEAHYHLVVVLDDMGRYADARDALDHLLDTPGLAPEFVPVLQLQSGILDLHEGKRSRGARRIRSRIDAVDATGLHPWMAGRARTALIDSLAESANALEFDTSEGRQKRNLARRVRLLQDAEAQMYAVFKTEEPEWITGSLLVVGRAYEDLAGDLAAARPPSRLRGEQVDVFRAELATRAEAPRTKAFNCYDKGIELAARLGWTSPVVTALREEREGLAAVR
ncbi:MAG: hypothetical protein FJ090_20565 [Deltaproteobacteria bacterium]|nr:hypothetical protein [Deltaproteobacteria bacterium]